jgi:hypothetical protein
MLLRRLSLKNKLWNRPIVLATVVLEKTMNLCHYPPALVSRSRQISFAEKIFSFFAIEKNKMGLYFFSDPLLSKA